MFGELWLWAAYNNRWVALIGVIGAVLCLVGVIARWARSSVERDVTDHTEDTDTVATEEPEPVAEPVKQREMDPELLSRMFEVNPLLAAEVHRGQERRKAMRVRENHRRQEAPDPEASISDQVKAAYKAARRDAERRAAEREQWEVESNLYQGLRNEFAKSCRLANPSDYAAWLKGWMERGGKVSNTYDYPLLQPGRRVVGGDLASGLETVEAVSDWMVLCEVPDSVPALHGAFSFHVIVPEDVDLSPSDLGDVGHSSFYFMRGFGRVGHFVPLYTDVAACLLDGES